MAWEGNHGNVSGILTLKIWKIVFGGSGKKQAAVKQPASCPFKQEGTPERPQVLSTLVNTQAKQNQIRRCLDKQLTRRIFRQQHGADDLRWNAGHRFSSYISCCVVCCRLGHDLRLGACDGSMLAWHEQTRPLTAAMSAWELRYNSTHVLSLVWLSWRLYTADTITLSSREVVYHVTRTLRVIANKAETERDFFIIIMAVKSSKSTMYNYTQTHEQGSMAEILTMVGGSKRFYLAYSSCF